MDLFSVNKESQFHPDTAESRLRTGVLFDFDVTRPIDLVNHHDRLQPRSLFHCFCHFITPQPAGLLSNLFW